MRATFYSNSTLSSKYIRLSFLLQLRRYHDYEENFIGLWYTLSYRVLWDSDVMKAFLVCNQLYLLIAVVVVAVAVGEIFFHVIQSKHLIYSFTFENFIFEENSILSFLCIYSSFNEVSASYSLMPWKSCAFSCWCSQNIFLWLMNMYSSEFDTLLHITYTIYTILSFLRQNLRCIFYNVFVNIA